MPASSGTIAAKLGEILIFAGTAAAFIALSKRSSSKYSLSKALQDGTSLNAKERVCTVDENNVPLPGGHERSEMRLKRLWHRATYVLVLHKEDLSNKNNSSSDHEESKEEPCILVQCRSQLKDYCPGKLDPTPGGVVGYGESYLHNATRELQEEMQIDVTSPDSPHTLKRLFTFPYQDDGVKVWGDFYEATYCGKIEDLVLQEEEVESLERMSKAELQRRIVDTPGDFMPDAAYALELYFQRKEDDRLKRRLLKGYSSGNLDDYKLRPKPKVRSHIHCCRVVLTGLA